MRTVPAAVVAADQTLEGQRQGRQDDLAHLEDADDAGHRDAADAHRPHVVAEDRRRQSMSAHQGSHFGRGQGHGQTVAGKVDERNQHEHGQHRPGGDDPGVTDADDVAQAEVDGGGVELQLEPRLGHPLAEARRTGPSS